MATKKKNEVTEATEAVEMAEVEEVAKEVVKRGRGRPKGTGGNKRPDLSWSGNQNVKPGDTGRYLRHALSSWDLPVIDISDEKQVEERLQWYFNSCIEDDVKPTVTGMCRSLGIDRKTLYRWGQGEARDATHSHLIKKAYEMMEEMWEGWMVNGKVNPVVGIFLGKNHFGYKDQQDVVIAPKNPLGEGGSEAEIKQRYMESVVVDEETLTDEVE
jgi:hypothetical protein